MAIFELAVAIVIRDYETNRRLRCRTRESAAASRLRSATDNSVANRTRQIDAPLDASSEIDIDVLFSRGPAAEASK
jgi:hypothetical protein